MAPHRQLIRHHLGDHEGDATDPGGFAARAGGCAGVPAAQGAVQGRAPLWIRQSQQDYLAGIRGGADHLRRPECWALGETRHRACERAPLRVRPAQDPRGDERCEQRCAAARHAAS